MPKPNKTAVVVRAGRKPPVNSLLGLDPGRYPVLIVADPDHYEEHTWWAKNNHKKWKVVPGLKGITAQFAECYRAAAREGYDWMLRLDDDLDEKTFVHKNGYTLQIPELISTASRCTSLTGTTLVGFHNGSNRHWMKFGYARTYGLIHGGAMFSNTAEDTSDIIDESVPMFNDVYATCAYRVKDGACGRVNFVGFDKSRSSYAKSKSYVTLKNPTTERVKAAKEAILAKFENMVTCEGERAIHGGTVLIPNWRMRRTPGDYRTFLDET